jgi:predicted HTH transcriptional regulator
MNNYNNNDRSGVRSSNDTGLKDSSSSNNFLRKDIAGLVRVLRVIEKAGKDGISTRELCEQTFKTKNYGMRVIGRAYDDGYIQRFGKNKRGHNKVNYLSDKGKELLSQLNNVK